MKEHNPLVSIIIPVYNTSLDLLTKCLDSVRNQTYHNLEIILIDDHSTLETTTAVLEQYTTQDKRFNLIKNQENKGLSFNRNLGVSICHGKFFTFLDSDDFLAETFIEEMLQAILESNTSFVICNMLNIQHDNQQLINIVKYAGKPKQTQQTSSIIATKAIFNIPVVACAKLFQTAKYKKSTLSFVENVLYEDNDWLVRVCVSLKSFVYINYDGYYRVVNKQSITQGLNKETFITKVFTVSRMYDTLSSNNLHHKYATVLIEWLGQAYSDQAKLITKKELQRQHLENLQEVIKYCQFPALNVNRVAFYKYKILYKISKLLQLTDKKKQNKAYLLMIKASLEAVQ